MLKYGITIFLFICEISSSVGQVRDTIHPDHRTRNTFNGQEDTVSNKSHIKRLACKGWLFVLENEDLEFKLSTVLLKSSQKSEMLKRETKSKFLTLQGDVLYDFYYRSRTDTPFIQQNIQQHTEIVSLRGVIDEKYPFRISFTARQSNSPLLRTFNDIGFQFDRNAYFLGKKRDALKLAEKVMNLSQENIFKEKYKDLINQINSKIENIDKWKIDPATKQHKVEEQINKYNDSIRKLQVQHSDNLKPELSYNNPAIKSTSFWAGVNMHKDAKVLYVDTLDFNSKIENIDRVRDSLKQQLAFARKRYDSIQSKMNTKWSILKGKIQSAKSTAEIGSIMDQYQIDSASSTSTIQKFLSDVKTLNIGRSMLNYSELTAQNIVVTGVNLEYNPSYYLAFTAGKIDYRFRDFFGRNGRSSNQYIIMGRLGWGNTTSKALIFSVYRGRKSQSDFVLNDSIANFIDIFGYSIETIYRLGKSTKINAEIAKSTKPSIGSGRLIKQNDNLLNISDGSNLGINVKAESEIRATKTKLSGFLRKTGESFQSFSLFAYNTDQTAWQIRADQPFWKNRLNVTGMLRKNDFTNPFAQSTFSSSTVFKSIQLTLRVPKWPTVSFGYFPGSQFFAIDGNRVRENVYYIMNASSNYSFVRGKYSFVSALVYNGFFNRATDSGFVSVNGTNIYATQSMNVGKLHLQAGLGFTRQQEIAFYEIDGILGYTVNNIFQFSIGPKYSKVREGSTYLGGTGFVKFSIGSLGDCRLQYERGFLPTVNNRLLPMETGRVTWHKTF